MTKVTLVQPHLSFSAISQFDRCPKSWYSQRILGKKQKSGEAASFGLAFEAKVIEAIGAPNEKEPTEEDKARTKIDDPQVARQIDAAVDIYLKTPGVWTKETPGTIVAQREIHICPERWGTLADMYGASGEIHLPLIGYIDLLHTEPNGLRRTVKDLKTTSDPRFKHEWVLQTGIYALVERAQKIAIDVLYRPPERPTKKPRPEGWLPKFKATLYEYRVTDALMQWVMSWVGIRAMQMREAEGQGLERMLASPNFGCQWCPEADTCEARMVALLTPIGGSGGTEEAE